MFLWQAAILNANKEHLSLLVIIELHAPHAPHSISVCYLWLDYSKARNTGMCHVCADVSVYRGASIFSIAEFGLGWSYCTV